MRPPLVVVGAYCPSTNARCLGLRIRRGSRLSWLLSSSAPFHGTQNAICKRTGTDEESSQNTGPLERLGLPAPHWLEALGYGRAGDPPTPLYEYPEAPPDTVTRFVA